MRRRVLATGVVSSALALAVACEVAFPTHLESAPTEEAGAPEAAAPEAAAPEAGCAHALPPPPPESDPNPNVHITFTAAMKEIVVRTETDAGVPLGFDLDGVCTCPEGPSCTSPTRQCDGPGGRDGAGDALIALLDAFFATTTEGTLNERIQKGAQGFLFWISDYNGEADDPNVYASILVSTGMSDDPDSGTRMTPKWDGTDSWNIDRRLVAGWTQDADGGYAYTPIALSTVAYVTHGTLVARIPKVTLNFGVATLSVTDVVFVGDISTTPYGYRIDGQFGGRIATREILTIASTIPDPTNPGERLCGDNRTYQSFRTAVCSTADLTADPARDNTGKPCDAVSTTFGLTAFSARTGAPIAESIPDAGCDGAVDDCTPP